MKSIFKSEFIKDPYFGEVEVLFDKHSDAFYLDKTIQLDGNNQAVILYIESETKDSNVLQKEVFDMISNNFQTIWKNTFDYLTMSNQIVPEQLFEKEYKLESITLLKNMSLENPKWEMDILNTKDGFSKIVVEFENVNPIHFSVEG